MDGGMKTNGSQLPLREEAQLEIRYWSSVVVLFKSSCFFASSSFFIRLLQALTFMGEDLGGSSAPDRDPSTLAPPHTRRSVHGCLGGGRACIPITGIELPRNPKPTGLDGPDQGLRMKWAS
ncbi:hypothetical protein ACLOJK_003815 [Asimina triloba]